MWLERISLKDFRCFHGEHSIDFSTDPEKNITLIHAENGVGKTTLLNSLLWCFYGDTTAKFEKRDDLINYDALAASRTSAYVEVLFEHNDNRYRARRYTKNGAAAQNGREFLIMRIDAGHHVDLNNPDAFINTVIPKGMARHFLFDGEHAEVFLGEDNRGSIRRAVQDILGCSLITTAIKDLADAATYYRRQMPTTRTSVNIENVSRRIDLLTSQIQAAIEAREELRGNIEIIDQQIADIDDNLRNSAAAKTLAERRESLERDRTRSKRREVEAQDEVLRWLGDNGRFLVSTRITDLAFDRLNEEEIKGRIPAPYNEEFVSDILEMQRCICGAELKEGSDAYHAVHKLLDKAANATMRSRLTRVRARLNEFKTEKVKAPTRLESAMHRLADAQQDISRHEADLNEISEKLSGIDLDEIAQRELKRNELRSTVNRLREQIGTITSSIARSESDKLEADRELKKLAEEDTGSRIFLKRYNLCESIRTRLERELLAEEKDARAVLRASIGRVLDETVRKAFRLRMTEDYGVSLVNEAGTQLPKSSGENQLLGLAFTAALVNFAKVRQNAADYRLLRGTVAPLVLDSPFGQLDEDYRKTTALHIPQMASQVVLMVSRSQASGGVLEALHDRIGEEYVIVRHNKDARGGRKQEIRQINGKDVETALFDASFDGSSFAKVTRQ
jgi:DNA sulfur modification protein DndD